MTNKIATGNRIKQIRLAKGDTLEEFGIRISEVLNIPKKNAPSKSNVSKWESGSSLPNNTRLKAIAIIGDMTIDELMYGEEADLYPYIRKQFEQYYKKKKTSLKNELKFIFQSIIDTPLYMGGFREAAKHVIDEEHRLKFMKEFKEFGEVHIKTLYEGYSYEKFLNDFPGSNLDDFQKYKHNEWKQVKLDFDKIIDDYKSNFTDDNNIWINKAFTSQIDNELTVIRIKAINENNIDYYVNEAVQSILDEAAQKIKNLSNSFDN